MPDDPRFRAHLHILKVALDTYLQHLAVAWQGGPAGAEGSVRAVLSAVGSPVIAGQATRTSLIKPLHGLSKIQDGPLAAICTRLELSVGEEILIAAAGWAELDPQLGSVFGVLHDDGARRYPSCGLLHLAFEPFGVHVPVEPRRLLTLGVVASAAPSDRLALTATAREVINGEVDAVKPTPRLPQRLQAMVDPLIDLISSESGPVTLRGPRGSGRHALAAAAASGLNATVTGPERPVEELRLLARTGIALPVLDTTLAAENPWSADDGPLVWIAGPDDHPSGSHVVDVPVPLRDERTRLWRAAMRHLEIQPSGTAAKGLADRFRFTETDIASTVTRAQFLAQVDDRNPDAADLWAAAQRGPDVDLGLVATRVVPVFTLDDLVLSETARSQLEELVSHVEAALVRL